MPDIRKHGRMFAVIKSGGKQYKVAKEDVIRVEKLDAEEGARVALDQVLMVGDGDGQTVGAPLVVGASVSATVLEQVRDRKIIVFKKKRRQNYRRRNGHRQHLTVLRIDEIMAGGNKKAAPKKKAAAKKNANNAAPASEVTEAEEE
ncbi:MAG: 50S ribosomal protein L21 [Alphaproteobacteria bacterium MarineAlpha4_Bin2]|nr:MAG: 50S ribosomal protein L21 [Alphaproteobacteria bacterium MarineAlpha4_Bin2]